MVPLRYTLPAWLQGGERTLIYSSCSELMLEKAALGKEGTEGGEVI